MAFVLVAPDVLGTVATDIAQIGSAVSAGNLAAAIPTTAVAAAAADEVSAAIAEVFGAHAREYQAAATQVAAYSEQFVRTLNAAAAAYAGTDAATAASLAGLGSSVSNELQAFVYGPIHAIDEAWIGSPLGRALDPIIGSAFGGNGGTGGNGTSIVVDFVRHGQSIGNATGMIDTAVPGTVLTQLGQQQAQAIANALAGQGPFAGIFASQLTRTQQTAAPLAGMLGMNMQLLPGLNEIDAGVFDGLPQLTPAGLLYLVAPVAWTLGFPLVPMLAPGSTNINGVVFDQGFAGALNSMYGNAMTNPVLGTGGKITEVAFSSEFAIEVGTMMNVNNPDPLLMLTHPLPNTGTVVVQGDPQHGWTLVSWDGVPVPPASLPTKLFVDVRDLIEAPQFAAYNGWQALGTGDPTTIVNAVHCGVDEVGAATLHFPLAVTRDLVDAVRGSSVAGLSTELASLLP